MPSGLGLDGHWAAACALDRHPYDLPRPLPLDFEYIIDKSVSTGVGIRKWRTRTMGKLQQKCKRLKKLSAALAKRMTWRARQVASSVDLGFLVWCQVLVG